jgi:hypothetical protein
MEPAKIVGYQADDPQLKLTVSGSWLSVEFTTHRNSCRSKGEFRIARNVEDQVVTLSPFDRVSPDAICLDILNMFDQSATVGLGGGGTWTVVLEGTDGVGDVVEFEFQVETGVEGRFYS